MKPLTLANIKEEVMKYQYLEDTSIIDVSLACIIANRLKFGDPVWLLIIGASSGGKSQILRPLAVSDSKFIHRVDDITENTFLSGAKAKAGEEISLLNRIGPHGIMIISDFTVIMSKSKETRATILSQFRMVYDGEMTKYSGNTSKPIRWPETGTGYMGILAGSTPSIYSHFEEVADMGERFIYYRMKDYDAKKATELALSRTIFGKDLDDKLSGLYGEYVKEVVEHSVGVDKDIILPDDIKARIIQVAMFAERVRTTTHKDWKGNMDKIPVPAMPMRVALQLMTIVKGLGAIRRYEGKLEYLESDLSLIDWLGYSLANEENRAVLKVLAKIPFDHSLNTSTIGDIIGLDTHITGMILQNLSAVGVIMRNGGDSALSWSFKDLSSYEIVRRIEHIKDTEVIENRATSNEEVETKDMELQHMFDNFGN